MQTTALRTKSQAGAPRLLWEILIALGIAIALFVAADLLLQIHAMAGSLEHVNARLATLERMASGLDRTNGKLALTNTQLRLTNAQLHIADTTGGQSVRQSTAMSAKLSRMQSELARTDSQMAQMRALLSSMHSDIAAMTKKITHAKLLF